MKPILETGDLFVIKLVTEFILCNLLGLSIQTSMQNLEFVAQKMAELLHNYVIM